MISDAEHMRLVSALPPHKQAAYNARLLWMERARSKQVPPPDEDWFIFLAMAGRGFGKSLLGANEAWWHAAWNEGARVAVVAPTAGDLRRTCFEGTSGILSEVPHACLEGGDPSTAYNRSLFELRFKNGSLIQGYSAAEPGRLRGPNFSFAWADELAEWDRAQEAWDMLMMTLRIGERPQAIVTTTPRPIPLVRHLVSRVGNDVWMVRGSTRENAANLAPSFLAQLEARYAGTRLGRQEVDAELLEDVPGTLWPLAVLEACHMPELPGALPVPLAVGYHHGLTEALGIIRVVVGIDPSGARRDNDEKADEIGIVVAGADGAERGYVLEDASGAYSPETWARKAIEVYDRWGADRIVAEANFGGGLVEANIRSVRRSAPVQLVTASRGKAVRAEPVAALYEQGRVKHCGVFPMLEEQLGSFTRAGYRGDGSPDRADALVWAMTDLLLKEEAGYNVFNMT